MVQLIVEAWSASLPYVSLHSGSWTIVSVCLLRSVAAVSSWSPSLSPLAVMASDNPSMLRDPPTPRWSPGSSPHFVQTPGGSAFAVVQAISMDQEVRGEHWIVRLPYREGRKSLFLQFGEPL